MISITISINITTIIIIIIVVIIVISVITLLVGHRDPQPQGIVCLWSLFNRDTSRQLASRIYFAKFCNIIQTSNMIHTGM